MLAESHFLSDVHLPFDPDPVTERFLQYLSSLDARTVREVFLLGDIFHYWVHDSEAIRHAYRNVLDTLEAAVDRGITVHFFPGNRDFLFAYHPEADIAGSGLRLHLEPEVVAVGKRRVYVSHGDELCVGDRGYMIWKKFSRNPFILALFDRLPKAWRLRLVNRMSRVSRGRQAVNTPSVPTELYRRLLRRGADTIIHGHLHMPCHRKHEYPPGEVYVLNAWDADPSVLVYNHDSDEFTVRRLNNTAPQP
jgi:UDP-2,3-diacylglucosamine hydrolase